MITAQKTLITELFCFKLLLIWKANGKICEFCFLIVPLFLQYEGNGYKQKARFFYPAEIKLVIVNK